jgi:transcriptional regulator with XRE-family HTH domain
VTIGTVRTTATVKSRGQVEEEDRLFVAWVRNVMVTRRLTQRQVAMLAGVDHSTISRLLSGDRVGLRYVTALRLYRALEKESTRSLLERSFSRGDETRRGGANGARLRPMDRQRVD